MLHFLWLESAKQKLTAFDRKNEIISKSSYKNEYLTE
jgi:hypothetical protein